MYKILFKDTYIFGKTVKKSKEFWIVVNSEGRGECNHKETSKEVSGVLACFFIL